MRGAGVADGCGEVVDHGRHPGVPSRFDSARTARACRPVTITRSTCSGVSPADFRAAFHACSPSGTYFVSPNRSSQTFERRSPGVRQRSRNSSVARAAPEVLGDHRCAGVRRRRAARPRRHRPPPRPGSSGGRCGDPMRRRASVPEPSSAARSAPTPERAAPPRSRAARSESSRGAAWMAVAFVLSRYAGFAVANHSAARPSSVGDTSQREPGRLDAHGGGVLVVGRRPTGCPFRRRCRTSARSPSAAVGDRARSRRR